MSNKHLLALLNSHIEGDEAHYQTGFAVSLQCPSGTLFRHPSPRHSTQCRVLHDRPLLRYSLLLGSDGSPRLQLSFSNSRRGLSLLGPALYLDRRDAGLAQ